MATIASLVVNLVAGTASFERSMARAGRTVRLWGAQAAAFAAKGAVVLAAAATAAAVAIAAHTLKAAQNIDAIAKLTDRLGVTTEAYTGLAHAANLAGVDNEAFGRAMEQMSRRIGEAATEGGATADALAQLGLKAEDLARMTADQQFRTLADAMRNTENASVRAALAVDLFGKSGQPLINTLMLGSEGLATMSAEAEALGITFSRVDAAKVEEMNDTLTRVKATFQGFFQQLAIQFAPLITHLGRSFVGWMTQGNAATGKAVESFKAFGKVLGFVVEVANALRAVFHFIQGTVLLFAAGALKALSGVARAFSYVTGLGEDTAKMLADMAASVDDEATTAFDTVAELFNRPLATDTIPAVFEEITDAANESAQAVADSVIEWNDLSVAVESVDEAAKAMDALKKSAERVFEETRTPLEKHEAKLSELKQLYDQQLITLDTYQRAVAAATAEYEKLTDAKEKDRDPGFLAVNRALMRFEGGASPTAPPKIGSRDDLPEHLRVLYQINTGIARLVHQNGETA